MNLDQPLSHELADFLVSELDNGKSFIVYDTGQHAMASIDHLKADTDWEQLRWWEQMEFPIQGKGECWVFDK